MSNTQLDTSTATCGAPEAQPQAAQRVSTYLPVVDVVETPEEYRVVADVPGARTDDIDIQYERGVLTLHARVNAPADTGRRYLLREYGVGDYRRTFRVGEGIATDEISATLNNGVLTLRLPKATEARLRRIAVRAE